MRLGDQPGEVVVPGTPGAQPGIETAEERGPGVACSIGDGHRPERSVQFAQQPCQETGVFAARFELATHFRRGGWHEHPVLGSLAAVEGHLHAQAKQPSWACEVFEGAGRQQVDVARNPLDRHETAVRECSLVECSHMPQAIDELALRCHDGTDGHRGQAGIDRRIARHVSMWHCPPPWRTASPGRPRGNMAFAHGRS